MTENAKFAACFSGLGELCRAKVSMLCSSSSSDDVRKIWKDVYNDEPPPEIEIVAEGKTCFRILLRLVKKLNGKSSPCACMLHQWL